MANSTPERASYPQFDSYDKRIRIENITRVNFDADFLWLDLNYWLEDEEKGC